LKHELPMLKVIAIIAALLAGAVAVVLALALTKPDDFTVSRRIVINAPPARIAPLIEDFRNWALWSPYERNDPAMKRTYSGAQRGKGAIYAWDGNNEVGSGRMEITDSGSSRVLIKLDFIAPFEASNVAEFALEPRVGGTEVSWTMRGPAPMLSKVMQVFINLDSMVGTDFAAGLASLKSAAEKS
jgi:hypothetical protein